MWKGLRKRVKGEMEKSEKGLLGENNPGRGRSKVQREGMDGKKIGKGIVREEEDDKLYRFSSDGRTEKGSGRVTKDDG